MFLDDQGNPDSKKSLTSHLASGTPGTVAGFSLALEKIRHNAAQQSDSPGD